MQRSLARSALVLIALCGTATMGWAKREEASGGGYNLSKPVQSAIAQAQAALAANNPLLALSDADVAVGQASNDDERYFANLVKYNSAIQAGKTTAANQAIDALITSPRLAAADKARLLMTEGRIVRRQDPRRAESAFDQAVALQPDNADVLVTVAAAKADYKKPAEAVALLDRAIAARKASGQPAPEPWYAREVAIAYDAKLTDQAMRAAQQWVAAYPTPENWHDALALARASTTDSGAVLDLFRLARAAGALKGESDYQAYAAAATAAGQPGEAKEVLAEGASRHMLDGPAAAKGKGKAKSGSAGVPRTALAGLAKTARASSTGKAAMTAADASLGYGDYAGAAELYRLALTKGGVDAATANTRLGIALARSGDKVGAAQALSQVTGPRAMVAGFWSAWMGGQGGVNADAPRPPAS